MRPGEGTIRVADKEIARDEEVVAPVFVAGRLRVGLAVVGGDAAEAVAAVVLVEGDAALEVGEGLANAGGVVGVADGGAAAAFQVDREERVDNPDAQKKD